MTNSEGEKQLPKDKNDKVQIIVSLRQWCADNGVKIRLTHNNHIVIQERKERQSPKTVSEEKVLVQDLIFIDRYTSVRETG